MTRLPRELYMEQHMFEQYDLFGFFDFCKFSSDEMLEASFQWKSLVLPRVLKENPTQHRRLVNHWETSKRTQRKYWSEKKLQEEKAAQLDDHIGHILQDTIKQTQDISHSLTQAVASRVQDFIRRYVEVIADMVYFPEQENDPFTEDVDSFAEQGGPSGVKKGLHNSKVDHENVQCPKATESSQGVDNVEGDGTAPCGLNINDDSDFESHAVHDEPIADEVLEELQELEEAIASADSPFQPLLKYMYRRMKGEDAELPPVPSAFTCQEYQELYQYSYDKLLAMDEKDKVKMKMSKGKGKKGIVQVKKAHTQPYHVDKGVLVALSGVVNTISPSTRSFTSTPAIKVDALVTALHEEDEDIAGLMNELAETYSPDHEEDPLAPLDMKSLRMRIWGLPMENRATSPKTRIVRRKIQVLQVIDHICTLISTNQLAPPTTEHVVVSVWSFILGVLLGCQMVGGIPGELASQDISLPPFFEAKRITFLIL